MLATLDPINFNVTGESYAGTSGNVALVRSRSANRHVTASAPAHSGQSDFVQAGALLSYGPNYPALFRRAAEYVDRILRGAKPGDLPVEQPTKFDLVINLTTAKALGLTVPPVLLARADEVIE